MKFSDLRLIEPLLRAVSAEGYETPTPIQVQSIPSILEGRDLLGCAQTGTGKTAAFALPILQKLASSDKPAVQGRPESHERSNHPRPVSRNPRCLVLCPTRELALQISTSFSTYGKNLQLRNFSIFGGVNQRPQAESLRRGVDILVATPGRLLDLMNQRLCDLRQVEILVLDEADRMLDMGFIPDIRRIVAQLPSRKQTLLFSATMPSEIRRLSSTLLHDPVTVQITSAVAKLDAIKESVYFVERQNKPVLLAHLVNHLPMSRAIVFTRTKHGADRVVRHLHKSGIHAEAIHGNKSQNARERALHNFRSCKTPVLVATDIASRGIDVDGITHVVNYDLTHEPETYTHRIGRTARAGTSGAAVSFCDREERANLKAIESMIGRSIPVQQDHPIYPASNQSSAPHAARPPQNHSRQHHQHQHHRPMRAPESPKPTFKEKARWPLGHNNQHRRRPTRQRAF